jgi:hypothetical protein
MVVDAINSLPQESIVNGFTLSDMGTADAGTSLSMIECSIEAVKARVPEAPVSIVYSDQPRNDFNALIANVYGLGPFDTYLDKHSNVFPLVSGTTFYKQIVPAASLDIGFSATAMHWMSSKVCNITNHVQAIGAEGEELEAFRAQAHRDWRQILLHRATELKPGGKLILINFGRDEQGRYLGNTGGVNMFDTFNQIWLDFLQAGLRLEHIDTRIVKCPFAEAFEQHGDAARFAEEYIPTIRSWNESTYFNALSGQRPLERRRQIVEDYYDSYRDLVRDNPEGHGMDYVHAYMVISKVF